MITVNATLKDANGAPIVGGFLRVTLCGYGALIPRVAGTNLIASTKPIEVQSNGAGLATFTPIGNDAILPAGTFYSVQVLDPDQNPVQTNDYQFTGAGVIDLSAVAPYNPPPVSIPPVTGIVPIYTSRTIVNPTAGDILATVIPQRSNPNAFYEALTAGSITSTVGTGGVGLRLTYPGPSYLTIEMTVGAGVTRAFVNRMWFPTTATAYWGASAEYNDAGACGIFDLEELGPYDLSNITQFDVLATRTFTGSIRMDYLVPRVTW